MAQLRVKSRRLRRGIAWSLLVDWLTLSASERQFEKLLNRACLQDMPAVNQ
jgi:hypothetical protein